MSIRDNIKSFEYVFISNIVSFLIAALVTFILPRYLSVRSFGLFQLYLFYNNYTGFLHFGWADGVFLRYGGAYYDRLNKKLIGNQLRLYCIFEILLGTFVALLGFLLVNDADKSLVIQYTGVSITISLSKLMILYILQATNRMKEYSIMTLTEKCLYCGLVMSALILERHSFQYMIIADLVGKFISLTYGIIKCKDIFFAPIEIGYSLFQEIRNNIFLGGRLMIANISSMLILGMIRFAIENNWDVETFGKISLTMSVSNMLMLFIRAVALVMYPILRRTDKSRIVTLYTQLRICLMIPLLGLLALYFPMRQILSYWLPKYSDSLKYMAMLFPVCVFESKLSMLIETYLKAIRRETILLYVNIFTVLTSALFTIVTVYIMQNLGFAVLSILILVMIKSTLSEIFLTFCLAIDIRLEIIKEIIVVALFIVSNWCIGGWSGTFIYILGYCLFFYTHRKDVIIIKQVIVRQLDEIKHHDVS